MAHWLSAPGKERDATASLAALYYMRVDVRDSQMSTFINWSREQLEREEVDLFLVSSAIIA